MPNLTAEETAPKTFDQQFDQAFADAQAEHAPELAPEAKEGETEPATVQPPGPPKEEPIPGLEEPSEEPLLTPEEEKLTGKAREKAYQRAFTQKTMALATQRKELEAAQTFLEALRENPQEALSTAAGQLGFTLAKSQEQPEPQAPVVPDKELAELIGPELAQKLSGVIQRMIQPVAQTLEQREIESEVARANAALEQLKTKYPDASKYDKQMAAIGRKLQVTDGSMSPYEYLETLYFLASKGSQQASQSAQAALRIEKAARSKEPSQSAAAASQVKPGPPPGYEKMSFDKQMDIAAEAAKRGEVWD